MPDLDEEERRVRIAELILRLRRVGITDQRIVGAIEAVPRDLFVEPESRAEAYAERALPIACGQTLPPPGIVGRVTAALAPGADDHVLEIGTGSGYQAAVLSKLCGKVFTVDRFRTLVTAAESRFRTLRLENIATRVGDGLDGWAEHAPYERIVISGACEAVPAALFGQLRTGGVLVAPVGPPDGAQTLTRYLLTENGPEATAVTIVRFVPLIPGVAERL